MPSKGRLLSTYPSTDVTQAEFNLLGDFTTAIHSSLPVATSSALGAVKVGTNLSINSGTGVLSATDTTYTNATTSASGLMTGADKTRLNNMADNANNYSLPVASSSAVGGFKIGTNLSVDGNNALNVTGGISTVLTETITVVSGMTISYVNPSTNAGYMSIPDVSSTRKSPEITLAYTTAVSNVILFLETGSHTGGGTSNLYAQLSYIASSSGSWSDNSSTTLSNSILEEVTEPISVHWAGALPSGWVNNGIKIRPMFRNPNSSNTRSFDVGGVVTLTAIFY